MNGRVRLFAALAVGAMALSACGDSTSVVVVKHLYFSEDGNGNGLFEIDIATGAATLVGAGETGVTGSTVGLTETGDTTMLLGTTFAELAEINTDGSGANVIAGSDGAEGLGMNTRTGVVYGAWNGDFFTLDRVTGIQGPMLAPPGTDVEGLAVDAERGVVYGIGGDSNLRMYDIAGDSWSVVGDTGVNWDQAGLAYDRFDNVLYAVGTVDDNLYTIDPTTGTATIVGSLGAAVGTSEGGLAFVGYEEEG